MCLSAFDFKYSSVRTSTKSPSDFDFLEWNYQWLITNTAENIWQANAFVSGILLTYLSALVGVFFFDPPVVGRFPAARLKRGGGKTFDLSSLQNKQSISSSACC